MKGLVGAIESVLTFFVVLILILLLLAWLGPFIGNVAEPAVDGLRSAVFRIWDALKNNFSINSWTYTPSRH
jgi:hypothetical protein